MSAQRLVRLKAEMTMMSKNPPPGIHCWLKESTSDVIMVEMEGPEKSPYEKGIFQLEVVLSERYPFTPPNVRFVTPIYHPNIDPEGRICLTALKPKPAGTWAVNLNIATVLSAIRILLSEPNLGDPLMTEISKQYAENYGAFFSQAEAETLKNARKKSTLASDSRSLATTSKTVHEPDGNLLEDEGKENEKQLEISSAESSCENVAKKARFE